MNLENFKEKMKKIFWSSNITNEYFKTKVLKHPSSFFGPRNLEVETTIGTDKFSKDFNLTMNSIIRKKIFGPMIGLVEGLEDEIMIDYSVIKESFSKIENEVKKNLLFNNEFLNLIDEMIKQINKDKKEIEDLKKKVDTLSAEKNRQVTNFNHLLEAFKSCYFLNANIESADKKKDNNAEHIEQLLIAISK